MPDHRGHSAPILTATWRPLPGTRHSRAARTEGPPGLRALSQASHLALWITEAANPGAWRVSIGSRVVFWQRFSTTWIYWQIMR